jgi:hypothetical protein
MESASEYYSEVVFRSDAVFNEPAPEYWVSFAIGGVRIQQVYVARLAHAWMPSNDNDYIPTEQQCRGKAPL